MIAYRFSFPRVGLGCLLPALALVSLVCAPARAVDPTITTADEGQVTAPILGIADGKLSLGGATPREIPLLDIERVEFGKLAVAESTSDLRWIGQDNYDLVQVGGASGGNGVQDIHLHVSNLKAASLKQIVVSCRYAPSKRLLAWRLDTTQSPHWRLAVARGDMASEAELYIEPGAEDSFDQTFDMTITYQDGTTTKASVKGGTHTSDQTKVDKNAPAGKATAVVQATTPGKAEVFWADGGRLQGESLALDAESLTLTPQWNAPTKIPLLETKGVWLGSTHAAGRAEFEKQIAAPAAEDVVLLLAQDKSLAQVAGSVQGLADGKLRLHYEDKDRTIGQERVLGVVFAAHPKRPSAATPTQVFVLPTGELIAGSWLAAGGGNFELETSWKEKIKLPAASVAEIRFRNGKLTYLGDLEPVAVVEVPYFGRMIHWRRDRGFDDGPAKLKGKQVSRCLAMHSHSVLTFAIDEQFEKFKATVGFDDSAGKLGRALCRATVDGREVFLQKDLRSDQDPVVVEFSVQGGKQLVLEVDYGEDQDVGDRVLWADARLFRALSK